MYGGAILTFSVLEQARKRTAVFVVDLKMPSENQIRYKHWTLARKYAQAVKHAWQSSLRSSPSAEVSALMTIISHLEGAKSFGTALRKRSELMTEIQESNSSATTYPPEAQSTP